MSKRQSITLGEWDHIAVIQKAHREQNTSPSMLASQFGRSLDTIKKWLEVQIPADAICNLPTNVRGKLLAAITLFGKHKTAEALGWPVQRLTALHSWYYRYRTPRTITWHGETERARHEALIAGEAKVAEYLANFSGHSKMSFAPARPPRQLYTVVSPIPLQRMSWVLSTTELQHLLRNAQWSSAIVSVKQDDKWYHNQQIDFLVYTTDNGTFELGYVNKITRIGKRFSPSFGRRYPKLLDEQLSQTNSLAATLHHKGMLVSMTFTRLMDSVDKAAWQLDWSHQHIVWDESVPKWAQESYPINEWAVSEMSLPELAPSAMPLDMYKMELQKLSAAKTPPPPPPPPRTPSQIKGAYADKLRLANVQGDVIAWVLHPDVTVADVENYLREYFPNAI